MSAVKSIKSQQLTAGARGGNISSASVSQQAQSPSFNVVGSSGVNQLAGAIGSQTQQPIKAYVSSNDITTAQSMDRNIIAGATIG